MGDRSIKTTAAAVWVLAAVVVGVVAGVTSVGGLVVLAALGVLSPIGLLLLERAVSDHEREHPERAVDSGQRAHTPSSANLLRAATLMSGHGVTAPAADADHLWRNWQTQGAEAERTRATLMRGVSVLIALGLAVWLLALFV